MTRWKCPVCEDTSQIPVQQGLLRRLSEWNTSMDEQLILTEQVWVLGCYLAYADCTPIVPCLVHKLTHFIKHGSFWPSFHFNGDDIYTNLAKVDAFQHIEFMALDVEAKKIDMRYESLSKNGLNCRARHRRDITLSIRIRIVLVNNATATIVIMELDSLTFFTPYTLRNQFAWTCPRELVVM